MCLTLFIFYILIYIAESKSIYKINNNITNDLYTTYVNVICEQKDVICKVNNTNLCAIRKVNNEFEFKDFKNSCYLFVKNLCYYPGEEFYILTSGSCEDYSKNRRKNNESAKKKSNPPAKKNPNPPAKNNPKQPAKKKSNQIAKPASKAPEMVVNRAKQTNKVTQAKKKLAATKAPAKATTKAAAKATTKAPAKGTTKAAAKATTKAAAKATTKAAQGTTKAAAGTTKAAAGTTKAAAGTTKAAAATTKAAAKTTPAKKKLAAKTTTTFKPLYDIDTAFDEHLCPLSCPDIYSPVCINVNRGHGLHYKFYTFVNHCEGDLYYCKHWEEFSPPPEEDAEMVNSSPLGWSFCGASRYLQFTRFAESASSMAHYGWLAGKQRYSHIMEPHERKENYG